MAVGDRILRAAVVHGLANAVSYWAGCRGEVSYDFIEIMACPGGCIAGGGQPRAVRDPADAGQCLVPRDLQKVRKSRKPCGSGGIPEIPGQAVKRKVPPFIAYQLMKSVRICRSG